MVVEDSPEWAGANGEGEEEALNSKPRAAASAHKSWEDKWPLPPGHKANRTLDSREDGSEGSFDLGSEAAAALREENCVLARENEKLRKKLEQAEYRARQVPKLQEDIKEAKREHARIQAAKDRAERNVEHAYGQAQKRVEFSQNERGELLQQIATLKQEVESQREISRRLQTEVREMYEDKGGAVERVHDLMQQAEQWKQDSLTQTAKLRKTEQRLAQIEKVRAEEAALHQKAAEEGTMEGVTLVRPPAEAPHCPAGAAGRGAPAASRQGPKARKLGSSASAATAASTFQKSPKSDKDDFVFEEVFKEQRQRRQRLVLAALVAMIVALAASKVWR